MAKVNQGKFFLGKVSDFTKKKGWFFGHFAQEESLKSDLVEVAWQDISLKKPDPTDRHCHKKSVEIDIVLSGWIKITLNNQRVKVSRGEFYIVWPETKIADIEAGAKTELIVIRAPSLKGDKFLV